MKNVLITLLILACTVSMVSAATLSSIFSGLSVDECTGVLITQDDPVQCRRYDCSDDCEMIVDNNEYPWTIYGKFVKAGSDWYFLYCSGTDSLYQKYESSPDDLVGMFNFSNYMGVYVITDYDATYNPLINRITVTTSGGYWSQYYPAYMNVLSDSVVYCHGGIEEQD